MNVLLLGAGASKSYDESLTKVRMPIAKDFFKTFNKLAISKNPWVLIGNILNYLRDFHGMPRQEFIEYNQDIEILHSEVEQKLNQILQLPADKLNTPENLIIHPTYMQLVFVFASVINEIQNGPPSAAHLNLAEALSNDDTVITFNWDTLMDRALLLKTQWNTDNGYLIKPFQLYKNEWLNPESSDKKFPLLLKLHGSTNWLTGYQLLSVGKISSMQEASLADFFIFESTDCPYSTFKGRFMDGYSAFSYGYYPPNLPIKGIHPREGHTLSMSSIKIEGVPKGTAPSHGLFSMPLIIPPVKNKDYSRFGNLFLELWAKAAESLVKADRIIVIGYSFPVTDTQTDTLFKNAFVMRTSIPEIFIVDPAPESIVDRFIYSYGIPKSNIKSYKVYFDKNFDVQNLFI